MIEWQHSKTGPMPKLVLRGKIGAEGAVAEQRFAGAMPWPPLLPGVLLFSCWYEGSRRAKLAGEKLAIFSEAGADTQTGLMIPPRPAYDKRRGSGRFRFGRQLWNVREHAKESR